MLQSVSSAKKLQLHPAGDDVTLPTEAIQKNYLEVLISERKCPRLMQEYEEKRQNV